VIFYVFVCFFEEFGVFVFVFRFRMCVGVFVDLLCSICVCFVCFFCVCVFCVCFVCVFRVLCVFL